MTVLTLSVLPGKLAVCQAPAGAFAPTDFAQMGFWSLTHTAEELSIVLPEAEAHPTWQIERGWRALKVCGPLDFGLVGILAELSAVLAEAQVSLFAISTYNTDYLLVKQTQLPTAVTTLRAAGHQIKE